MCSGSSRRPPELSYKAGHLGDRNQTFLDPAQGRVDMARGQLMRAKTFHA